MNIELQSKLLKLKGFLNEINHVSYSYSQLGRNYPMNTMDDEKAKQVIRAYDDLLKQVGILILNYEKSGLDKVA